MRGHHNTSLGGWVLDDPHARDQMIKSALLRLAKHHGSVQRITLSTLGPDNSMANHLGHESHPVENFPANLSSIFPWRDFYSWQATASRDYLLAGVDLV